MPREAKPKPSKPRLAAYGLFVFDPDMRALRAWPDWKDRRVCTVPVALKPGQAVWIYRLVPVAQVVIDDLTRDLRSWGYWPQEGDQQHAKKALAWRYDVENPYPIREGPEAGIKVRATKTEKVTRRRPKKAGKELFG